MQCEEFTQEDMQDFFSLLKVLESHFTRWSGQKPKILVISPEMLRKLSKVIGFYQRPELRSEVTAYSPIVRYFKLETTVVTIQEDYEEILFHFE